MSYAVATRLGWWTANGASLALDPSTVNDAVNDIFQPLYIVNTVKGYALGRGGEAVMGGTSQNGQAYPVVGFVSPVHPENLGDPTFCADHGIRYPYVSGGM